MSLLATVSTEPSREAIFFALGSGLCIGSFVSIGELIANIVGKKLNITEKDEAKSLAVYAGVLAIFTVFWTVAFSLFGLSYAQRREFCDRNMAEIGAEHFFSLSLLGTIAISFPTGLLRSYLRRRIDQ